MERLARQDGLYRWISRTLLEDAGLVPGMRVLDLGCGGGGFSLLASELVGEAGRVVGVDRSATALAAARIRAAALGRVNVEFVQGEIEALRLAPDFDAIVGRFVLMHQRSPVEALVAAVRLVRGQPRMAFLESDLSATLALAAHRGSTACAVVLRRMIALIQAAGASTDLGLRLGEVVKGAGLPAPALRLYGPLEAGPHDGLIEYLMDSVRSLNASADRLGVPMATEAELAELTHRLEQDAASGLAILAPLVVAAVV
jgi:ubiquinone/menaquinone biosynthesis C-methylase UbiE